MGKEVPDFDPVMLYVNARSFQEATRALDAQNDKVMFFWPTVIAEVLTLELFIKCLLKIRGRYSRGHNVHWLFNKLDESDRKTIEQYYDEIVQGHPSYPVVVARGLKMDVNSVLLRSRETFVNMRYWHEGTPPSTDADGQTSNAGAGNLADAIDHFIRELVPDYGALALRLPEGLILPKQQSHQTQEPDDKPVSIWQAYIR